MPRNSNSSSSIRYLLDESFVSNNYWNLDATRLYGIYQSDDRITWVDVDSTAIGSVGYNPHRKILYVLFKKGDLYSYQEVSKYKYNTLMAAQSKGAYLNKSIIGEPRKHPPKLMAKGKEYDDKNDKGTL